MFDHIKLADRMAQLSHNGGGSIASSYFPQQLRGFKRSIVSHTSTYCNQNSKKTFCKYRNDLFTKNKPLKVSNFTSYFSDHIRKKYKIPKEWTAEKAKIRRDEVASFLNKIDKHFKNFT